MCRGSDFAGRDHVLREPFRLSGLPREAIPSLAWSHHLFRSLAANAELPGHWQGLHNMPLLPCWKRLWIIREIILAKDILLVRGRETCHWSCLTSLFTLEKVYSNLRKEHPKYQHDKLIEPSNNLAEHVYDFLTFVESNERNYQELCKKSLGPIKPSELYSILSLFYATFLSDFEESPYLDLRDKIYCILRLLDEDIEDKRKILIDYCRPPLELGEISSKRVY